MTSFPVSTHDGPYSSNTIVSRSFLIVYGINIWISFYILIIESLLFFNLTKHSIILLFLTFPIQIFIGYFILVFSALFTAKLLLILINLIHPPKEGIFKRTREDRDFYFWSFRSVIKKWPIWIISLLPSSVLNNLTLTLFGVKTSFSNSINNANMDTEFIEFGKNITLGKGSFIKSCMVFGDYLVIKKIIIEDNVVIGPHSYISPGTILQKNTVLNTLSMTQYNQTLEMDSVYSGYPAIKQCKKSDLVNYVDKLSNLNLSYSHLEPSENLNQSIESSKPTGKFIKKIPTYVGLFLLLYFFAYMPILIALYFYTSKIFYPLVIAKPSASSFFLNNFSMLVLTFTPPIILTLHLSNIFLTVLITKICYYIICKINTPKEGVFHWKDKSADYDFYFLRSFLLRYIKWKIQRGPYPWLIKSVFNFIGNCHIGKDCVIEDMYLAKEFINVGENAYLGKILLTNQLWDKELTVKGVKIEDGVVVNDGCCIGPGTHIKKNTTVLPFSITSKNDVLDSNSVYFDATVKKIKTEEELIKILNFKPI